MHRVLLIAALLVPAAASAQQAAPASRPATAATAPAQPARPGPPAPQPRSRQLFIQTMDAEFRKIDADKDGKLTRGEIEAYQRVVATIGAQAANRSLFARLDKDRNGQLSAQEFAAVQAPPPRPNAAPMLAQTDLNKDQAVTLVEYRTGKLVNFDRMDADKDGVVSPAEMKAAGLIK